MRHRYQGYLPTEVGGHQDCSISAMTSLHFQGQFIASDSIGGMVRGRNRIDGRLEDMTCLLDESGSEGGPSGPNSARMQARGVRDRKRVKEIAPEKMLSQPLSWRDTNCSTFGEDAMLHQRGGWEAMPDIMSCALRDIHRVIRRWTDVGRC
jgi:hypothetical protein